MSTNCVKQPCIVLNKQKNFWPNVNWGKKYYEMFKNKLNINNFFWCVQNYFRILLESAADKPIVVIPDKVNKWAGEDDDEDVKVR